MVGLEKSREERLIYIPNYEISYLPDTSMIVMSRFFVVEYYIYWLISDKVLRYRD